MHLTSPQFERILSVPISLPQTELRRGKHLEICHWHLRQGEKLVLRSLTLHVVKILTPGEVPQLTTTALGTASVGLYAQAVGTIPITYVSVPTAGSASLNPFALVRVTAPGSYLLGIVNHTSNLDLAVAVTGAFQLTHL